MTPFKWLLACTLLVNISVAAFADEDDDKIPDQFTPKKIATSTQHTCVLSTKGQVKCWGYNASGELGTASAVRHGREPNTMGQNLPIVNFGSNLLAKDLCVGRGMTCVATTAGKVKCWGRNNLGQLGQERSVTRVGILQGEMGNNLPYTDLGSDFKAKELHCGESSVCALSDAGKLKCWGQALNGELGVKVTPKRDIGRVKGEMGDKLPVLPLPVSINLVAFGGNFGCAATRSDIFCWGSNPFGQVGNETNANPTFLPADPQTIVKVKLEDPGVSTVIEKITAGSGHTCALYRVAQQQKLKCWGSNTDGSLGIETTNNMGRSADTMGSKLPYTQLNMKNITQIEAHTGYSCALSKAGLVKCWGSNRAGSLGLGDINPRGHASATMGANLPPVNLDLPVIALSSGANAQSVCAIMVNHEIKCWGYGFYGTLGYEDALTRGAKAEDLGENLPNVRFR